ncbi:MAG: methyltransferase [Asticcacaulis sp.]
MPACDDKLLWDVINRTYHLPVLAAADEIGLFGYLEARAAGAEELRQHFGFAANPASAFLSLLEALGFLVRQDGLYRLTQVSRTYLLPQSPYYWGDMLQLLKAPPISCEDVVNTLKTGRLVPQNDAPDMWAANALDQLRAQAFTRAMHSHSQAPAEAVAQYGDFAGVQHLLDVGGASACFSIEIVRRYPQMTATILDLPVVCPLTEDYVRQSGLTERIRACSGDMFTDDWPQCDGVLFSNIFHDWDQDRVQGLMDKSYRHLPSGGRIYIHEIPLEDDLSGPLTAVGYSMDMALYTGGKQYSASELSGMLTRAGFGPMEATQTHGYFWLFSARKP